MFKYGKISPYRVKKIVTCFCIDIDATKTAHLLSLNRKTVNRYFRTFRTMIHAHQCAEREQFVGVVEVDTKVILVRPGFGEDPVPENVEKGRSNNPCSGSMNAMAGCNRSALRLYGQNTPGHHSRKGEP